IEKRRAFPTRITQGLQVLIQSNVINPVLQSTRRPKAPLLANLLRWFPVLQRIPARLVGVGIRPENVRTPETPVSPIYGIIPAGATCEDLSPISSSALRTRPDAFASSMKALTSASAAGLPLGTQTAVLELRNASSRMREPGIVPTRPDSDSRESAIASILPSRMAATAASTPAKSIWVALAVALFAARKVAVFATPPIPTPFALASLTDLIFEAAGTRKVLCSK